MTGELPAFETLETRDRGLLGGYLEAKRFVEASAYKSDIAWAESLHRRVLSEGLVLREAAWVIVNSGFRYAVARKLWADLEKAFCCFNPNLLRENCRPLALSVLNHEKKIDAIIKIAAKVRAGDWEHWHFQACVDPRSLAALPYIGKVTCYHLAKLLGVDTVKPDVHLMRAAAALYGVAPSRSYPEYGCLKMCGEIKKLSGDLMTVIDSVLWRWAEQKQATLDQWRELWGIG